jgi:hypothetical protein
MKKLFWISILCGLFAFGCASKQNAARTQVLVENRTPVFTNFNVTVTDAPSAFKPLLCEAVAL